jgi:hypothetical protein
MRNQVETDVSSILTAFEKETLNAMFIRIIARINYYSTTRSNYNCFARVTHSTTRFGRVNYYSTTRFALITYSTTRFARFNNSTF